MVDLRWLFALHILFFLVFVPRALSRWWRRARPAGTAPPGAGAPPGSGAPRTAPGRAAQAPRFPLTFHAMAVAFLYVSMDLTVLAPPGLWTRRLLPSLPWPGGALIVTAAALAAWTVAIFSSWRLSAKIDSDHRLTTSGPFRWVRNPIYLSMDLLALGTWLWLPTAPIGLGAVLMAIGGDLRARSEEKALAAAFGAPYETYRLKVRRFLPGVY